MSRYKKFAALSLVVMVVAVVGVFVSSKAQAALSLNCNDTQSGFSGWIACLIGNPTSGISGADTLFKGQKAIYDKIGSGGTTQTSGTPTSVYIEKAGSSINLGQIVTGGIPNGSTFWGMGSVVTGCSTMDCPVRSIDTQNDNQMIVVFHPSTSFINSYNLTKTRTRMTAGGATAISFKPTMCVVHQENKTMTNAVSTSNNGIADVEKVTVRCSYIPNICNTGRSDGLAQNGCLGRSEFTTTLADYTSYPPAPQDQYRIVIK